MREYLYTLFSLLPICSSFTLPSTFLSSQTKITARTSPTILHSTPPPSSSSPTATSTHKTQVLILGSGPAARTLAALLHSSSIKTTLADTNVDTRWIPNYGAWTQEWEALSSLYSSRFNVSLSQCVDREWNVTDCYFGGSFDIPDGERMRLDRGYIRVDRDALRESLTNGYEILKARSVSEGRGVNLYQPAGSLVHGGDGSVMTLETKSKEKIRVEANLIVDCTGHESSLVLKDYSTKSLPAGFQIAYGALVEVEESSPSATSIGPYDKEAMTLFDYRTDHIPSDPSGISAPTFMYCMPLKDNLIFFEETSLVARPAVSFGACKERMFARLAHLGVTVTKTHEEEFCYIPMGGPLPAPYQRVIGFGGAAAMVHPSTGYSLCRVARGALDVAEVIRDEITKSEGFDPDRAAAMAYNAIWSPSNIAQRNFAVFGGEFLMKQDVVGLRGFFGGFFRLPEEMWAGFLAGWPGLPNNSYHETWFARLKFGLLFVSKLPFPVAWDMLWSIVSYSVTQGVALPQSVTPLLGLPRGYGTGLPQATVQGDVAAKMEAMTMIRESEVTRVVPVAFGESEEESEGGMEGGERKDDVSMALEEQSDAKVTEESFQ